MHFKQEKQTSFYSDARTNWHFFTRKKQINVLYLMLNLQESTEY